MDTQQKTYGKVTRSFILAYGVISYMIFFVTFLYAIGFLGGFLVPTSLDGLADANTWQALAIDLGLLSLFAVQHSVMARPGFKAALTRYWPAQIERSLYVAMSALALYVLYRFWLPMPTMVWTIELEVARMIVWVIAGLGWTIVLFATFLLNHFELFGLRQIWHDLTSQEMPSSSFRTPLFYKLVRHPIYTGFLIAFWATPDLSVGHLLFNLGMTAYILIGVRYEERDLKADLGQAYIDYTKQVGKVIPGVGKSA